MKKSRKMKIAMVAPPFGDTGGPEVVVQNLTDALLKKGIDVTLFAPGDWKTRAKLVPTLPESLWNMKNFEKQKPKTRRNLIIISQIKVLIHQEKYDIIHLNSQSFAGVVAKLAEVPTVISFHNKILQSQHDQLGEAKTRIVALSRAQKGDLNVAAVIWNGVPVKEIKYSFKKGDYLMFIGRLADQKGPDVAIKIARRANKKLLIFGRKGGSKDRKLFFNKKIKPYLGKDIIYMGEVSNKKIYDYLKGAEALLLPIIRPEVCPVVVSESLSCGTPVIGTKINPLSELLGRGKHEKVSYLSNNIGSLVKAVKNLDRFDREECRKYAEKYFDSSVMAEKYINLYEKVIKKHKK